jgi:hypothetical protein
VRIKDIYVPRNRGPWHIPDGLNQVLGNRERRVMNSRTCEAFPHRLNRDLEEYIGDDCITYYCPHEGEFTLRSAFEIVG